MKARSVDPKHHVPEWPPHVLSLLYYVPDAILDSDEIPVPTAPQPARGSAISPRPPFADPGAPIRDMDVDCGSRAPAIPRRHPPALPLWSVVPPQAER